MSSREDVLKIAQADMDIIDRHLSVARRPHMTFTRPVDEAKSAVVLLERTARRMRKAFGFEEPK